MTIKPGKPSTQGQDAHNEPIAIIGIGCRYPGGVHDPQTFWQLLVNGTDAITDIPADRADLASYYDPILATPGKIASRQGGFLEKIDQFDASFFGVSPREANYMDPQQRLLLETSWEALEDAGQVPEKLKESQTGVFIGMWANDYTEKMYKSTEDINLYITTGGGRYAASGRLSYFFGFQGPSLTVDTACSSSLVTIHLACQSLREGESTLALAGGVNLILEPSISIGYSRSKMLSPDGRCKFGDVKANGYVRSEGVGMVVLKRLSQALADHDPIYAVIRGSAVNNDGRSSELLVAPGIGSQIKMLRDAYRNAGVDPCQVGYVEAHGTGTPIGDPVELEAIGTVLSENRDATNPLRIGSVKTNIGHTEAASGVAGLIKTALILKQRSIPASLHFSEPNPKIPWTDLKIKMQTELAAWPNRDERAIAAVNSFGITGTNAHVVLEEAPTVGQPDGRSTSDIHILPLSAQTPKALEILVDSYLEFLSNGDLSPLRDICYTAGSHRTHHTQRVAVTGTSAAELIEQLRLYRETPAPEKEKVSKQTKVAFVFPGQGAQWLGMGRELMQQNEVFRQSLLACDTAFKAWTNWSLVEQLSLEEDSPAYRLAELSVIQPTLFAMEVALAHVWRSLGIEPSAVIGHSMGEVAAAHIAGALDLNDAAHIICKRSELMQRTSGKGAMAVIGLSYDETSRLINGYEDRLSIAVENSPRNTVVSGDPDMLKVIMHTLQEQEIFNRLIKADVASHSPQMDAIVPELVESLNDLQPGATAVPFYSTVAQDVREGSSLDAEYWGRNLRQPVRFSGTVRRLLDDEHVIFIEMNPHPALLSSIEEIRNDTGRSAYGFASMRRNQPELATLLQELGSLYALGYDIDWNKVQLQGRVAALPTYPWQRERYWFESTPSPRQSRPGAHPLLGQYLQSATGEHIWETTLNTKLFPYLNDHRVRGAVIFPAAGYVEMMLAAAFEIHGTQPYILAELAFQEALFLSDDKDRSIQLMMNVETTNSATLQVFSRAVQNDSADAWTLHASGRLEIIQENGSNEIVSPMDQPSQEQADGHVTEFYSAAFERGLEYGSNFQAVTQVTQQQAGIVTRIGLPNSLVSGSTKYQLHPVVLDACFQTLVAALPDSDRDTYLPVELKKIRVHVRPTPGDELWCYVTSKTVDNRIIGDIQLSNKNGQLVMSASALMLKKVESKPESASDLLYEIDWQASAPTQQASHESRHWLIFADRKGTGLSLAEKLQRNSQSCTIVQAGDTYRSISSNNFEIDASQPADFVQVLRDVAPVQAVIYLWSLDEEDPTSITNAISLLHLTQAVGQQDAASSPRIWIVTRGAQSVTDQPELVSVSQAAVWGMGAVIANEFPRLHCTRVDLSYSAMDSETELLSSILRSDDEEDQVALRDRQRYVARLKRVQPPAGIGSQNVIHRKVIDDQPIEVQITTPGILDGLSIRPAARSSPKTGQVEIAVKASGLNFMNVMAALGVLPGYDGGVGPLGIECSGVIASVGEGVTDFKPGDEVAGIAYNSLASYAVTDARLVITKPAYMSFEEAATIPIAYLTAYYAFHYLGRLQPGERVLIHAATGGVGLAAIQLAKRVGAEIFATAGSDEKREYLRNLGITHIMDSRSLSFADDILKVTNGEGVDLVLNSLAGPAIDKGLQILKPYGRFLEIGKRDIYGNSRIGLSPFQKNLSYFAIDLDKMGRERPDIVGRMLHEVFELLATREITALPVQRFPVSKVSDGFRMMAQAKHIGKIAISLDDPDASFELPAGAASIHADGTYLITGGLGDLGLTFARWLTGNGARHLVLMGRTGPSQSAQKSVDELKQSGVDVIVVQADVTDMAQLQNVFAGLKNLPPISGVIHAAGLLADATIPQMDVDHFKQAYAPKALGAWNLHTLTLDQPLDLFILISSVAATLGIPGQVNYAAGNAFLDGLARFRRAQNLPALSINWGPWSEIGLAARRSDRGDRLSQQGLGSITPSQGLEALSAAISHGASQVSVVSLNINKWCAAQPAAARSSLFNGLLDLTLPQAESRKPHARNIRAELMDAEAGRQRRALFDTILREHVAQVLHLPASRVPSDKPLKNLGLDSLMSIELRNRLEDGLGVPLSASLIWNHPTVNALAPFLAEKLGILLDGGGTLAAAKELEAKPASNELDGLDKDELEALLAEELTAIDDALKGSGFDTETGSR